MRTTWIEAQSSGISLTGVSFAEIILLRPGYSLQGDPVQRRRVSQAEPPKMIHAGKLLCGGTAEGSKKAIAQIAIGAYQLVLSGLYNQGKYTKPFANSR